MASELLTKDQRRLMRQVGELLRKPEHRCIDSFARDLEGAPRHWDDDDACSFCLSGAFFRAMDKLSVAYDEELICNFLDISTNAPDHWDNASEHRQNEIVVKLLNA